MAAAWGVYNDDFARLIRQVEESMGYIRWQVSKTAFYDVGNLVTDADFVTAFQDVNSFLLPIVNVQRRSAPWGYLNSEVVKCAACILASNFENEVTARAAVVDLLLRLAPSLFWWQLLSPLFFSPYL